MKANRKMRVATASASVLVAALSMSTMQSTCMLASAFMGIDRSSSSRTQVEMFQLFSNADDSDEKKKAPSIQTVTDANMDTLLHPPSSPDRPVLVDAFAPFCGPCKLLDKVLRKAQPNYLNKVDFCRWNVSDMENTAELKKLFLESGYTLTKLPSLIVFRAGKPVAVRPGFANEFQLDDWLEKTLPDVLERTFDENGVKMIPMFPEVAMAQINREVMVEERKISRGSKEVEQEITITDTVVAVQHATDGVFEAGDCITPQECIERLENELWKHRTVVPAINGILLPARFSRVSDSQELRVTP
ncbi:hypothetical protein ACHAWU_009832 [Discostella pseudostelligera]|uniref:Thioredoxin domain-containing protein n=1 Tax=Discostella pseudostelligera TaxID=259834 RepID=A0ABD3M6K9_9STRA